MTGVVAVIPRLVIRVLLNTTRPSDVIRAVRFRRFERDQV